MATTTGTATAEATRRVREQYPRQVTLPDGKALELRLMGPGDIDAVLAFARSLSPEDLMYLRVNVTEADAVDSWIDSIKRGRTITVLAVGGSQVVGEGTLLHHATTWTRHLGEIRLQISPTARRKGLGRLLANEIDAIAKILGLQMLTARMTLDQVAAQAVFRRLGFQREAVLWDYVITQDGRTRNVLVATKHL